MTMEIATNGRKWLEHIKIQSKIMKNIQCLYDLNNYMQKLIIYAYFSRL